MASDYRRRNPATAEGVSLIIKSVIVTTQPTDPFYTHRRGRASKRLTHIIQKLVCNGVQKDGRRPDDRWSIVFVSSESNDRSRIQHRQMD